MQPLDERRAARIEEEITGPAIAAREGKVRVIGREFKHTDYGNAERIVSQHGDEIRHCSGAWFIHDGSAWRQDETGEIVRRAKATIRSIYAEAGRVESDSKRSSLVSHAAKSEKAPRITAAIQLAASESEVACLRSVFDVDPFLFNVANGTIDLRTGELREHRREDLISKISPVRFDRNAACPRWSKFLSEVFEPTPDVIPFLRRAIGYSLTADTREECLFILHGSGRNGKGTFIKIVAELMNDYAATADFSTFTLVRDQNRGPRDDIAVMVGKRFVAAAESREGAALDESVIKHLTGGDRVRARLLYQNSHEFTPTHKIWLATNHKPQIRGNDLAIWSRIKLVPFGVSFDGREDKTLKNALLTELPGILNWAIAGCLEWQGAGLGLPQTVVSATAEYRSDSDVLGRFIAERCVTGDCVQARARALYSAYRAWAERTGEDVITETAFGRRVTERGFTKSYDKRGTFYHGIGLSAEGE